MGDYGTCECHSCYRRVPKPEAHKIRIQVEKGRSGGSMRFGRSVSYSTGRTYYTQKDVWVCASCYASTAQTSPQKATGFSRHAAVGVVVVLGAVVFMSIGTSSKKTSVTQDETTPSQTPVANFVRPVEPAKAAAAPPSKDIAQIQHRLIELGYLGGSADGVWGAKSRAALRSFKTAHGLAADEHWDDVTGKRLLSKNAVRAPLPVAKAQ